MIMIRHINVMDVVAMECTSTQASGYTEGGVISESELTFNVLLVQGNGVLLESVICNCNIGILLFGFWLSYPRKFSIVSDSK